MTQVKAMTPNTFLILFTLVVIPATLNANNELVLHEHKLGKMNLSHGMQISLQTLREKLKPLVVTKKTGQQDGPDYTYYQVNNNKKAYFSIKTQDSNAKRLESITIKNKAISDQYTVRVGMSYPKLKSLRPKVTIKTEHYHTYIYVKGSNIVYEISGDYNGPDKNSYTESDVKTWKVIAILWEKPPS